MKICYGLIMLQAAQVLTGGPSGRETQGKTQADQHQL
jgi:hypothetical protein